MSKIIIIRGNSGSGKSCVAKSIQEQIEPHPMLIQHDVFRREILKEHEGQCVINDKLILQTVKFGLKHNKNIIIEGIMRIEIYKKLFDKIIAIHPNENYFYFLDIPFKETLRRHATKVGVDFGEKEMRLWYKKDDLSGYPNEVVIHASSSLESTVSKIIKQTGLNK